MNLYNQIPKLQGVTFCSGDYQELHPLPKSSLIYCAPPYKGTKCYPVDNNFDYPRFYDWCRKMNKLGHFVFVSEYSMPEDFSVIWQKQIKDTLSSNDSIYKTEKLYHLK